MVGNDFTSDVKNWLNEFDSKKLNKYCEPSDSGGQGGGGVLKIMQNDMETGKMPPYMIKFIKEHVKTGKLYLIYIEDTKNYFIVNARDALRKLSGAVIIGAYTKVNMDILLRLYNGQCIIWNTFYGDLGIPQALLTHGSNIASLSYEVLKSWFPRVLSETLSLATGLQYRGAITVASICTCLFVYLLHKFFTKIEEAQSLDQDAINQARQTYLKKLLKDHTHRITRKEVKMAAEDKEISEELTKIAVRVVKKASTREILNLYINLFKKTSGEDKKVRKIIVAAETLKYLSGVLYKKPTEDIKVAWGDIKAMISLLIGKESITYDTDIISRDTKTELLKLELKQFITEDLPNLVIVLKVSNFVSQFMSERSSVNRVNYFNFLKKKLRGPSFVKNPRSSKSGTGSESGMESESKSSSSMGGSSRKPRNKRKTIRRKVSKTKKRTLNKKSKKRSKTKRIRK